MHACWMRAARAVLLLGVVSGCGTDAYVTAPQPTEDDLRASVSGDAAATVTATGKFLIAQPLPGLADLVAQGDAVLLATAWSRQFGPLLRGMLEQAHGAPIRLDKVAPCGRPLYAVSPFKEPPLDMLPAARRSVGPWWLVTLCEGSTPKLSVAVSAWATELRLENGRIVFPPNAGMEFYGHGIPLGHTGEYPASPERAAVAAAQITGGRVTNVPRLIAGFNKGGHPGHARWQWSLDRRITARTADRSSVATSDVFVGEAVPIVNGEILYLAAQTQPDTVKVESPPAGIVGESRAAYEERVRTQTRVFSIERLPDIPALFDRVLAVERVP